MGRMRLGGLLRWPLESALPRPLQRPLPVLLGVLQVRGVGAEGVLLTSLARGKGPNGCKTAFRS